MLVTAKRYELAFELYNKLRSCAHTNQDIITIAYALRQMSHCFMKEEKYENALICLKYLLSIAWTIKLSEIELQAYEGMALAYLYLRKIEKVKFYDGRIMYGIYESETSQTYKITVSQTLFGHPWLKDTMSHVK